MSDPNPSWYMTSTVLRPGLLKSVEKSFRLIAMALIFVLFLPCNAQSIQSENPEMDWDQLTLDSAEYMKVVDRGAIPSEGWLLQNQAHIYAMFNLYGIGKMSLSPDSITIVEELTSPSFFRYTSISPENSVCAHVIEYYESCVSFEIQTGEFDTYCFDGNRFIQCPYQKRFNCDGLRVFHPIFSISQSLEKFDEIELVLRWDALMRFWEFTTKMSDSELNVLTQDATVRPLKVSPIQTLQLPPQLKGLYTRINGASEVYKASANKIGGVPFLSIEHRPSQTNVGEIIHIGGEHFIWQFALPESVLPKDAYPICTMKSWALNAVPGTGMMAATHVFSIDEIDGEFDLFLDPFFSELDDFLLNWADNDAEIRRRSNQNSKVLGPFVQSCVYKFYRDFLAIAAHEESDFPLDFPLDYVEYCECMFETLPELQSQGSEVETKGLWTFQLSCAEKQVNWTSFYNNLPVEAKNQMLAQSLSSAKRGILESCRKGLPLYFGDELVFDNDESLNEACNCFVNSITASESYAPAVAFNFSNWINLFESTCMSMLPNKKTTSLEEDDDDFTNSSETWACGRSINYQGYEYGTVLIGNKCWFKENLRSGFYNNGDFIPSNLNNLEWSKTTSGARTTYGQEGSKCYDDTPEGQACNKYWSLAKHGFLYNAYAVMDERGLCPSGWHVPTDSEFVHLISLYNGGLEAQEAIISRSGWASANGNNRSGFSGLPGGSRETNGDFIYAGVSGMWWSSSPPYENGELATWYEFMNQHLEVVSRESYDPQVGFSIRCIQDTE